MCLGGRDEVWKSGVGRVWRDGAEEKGYQLGIVPGVQISVQERSGHLGREVE